MSRAFGTVPLPAMRKPVVHADPPHTAAAMATERRVAGALRIAMTSVAALALARPQDVRCEASKPIWPRARTSHSERPSGGGAEVLVGVEGGLSAMCVWTPAPSSATSSRRLDDSPTQRLELQEAVQLADIDPSAQDLTLYPTEPLEGLFPGHCFAVGRDDTTTSVWRLEGDREHGPMTTALGRQIHKGAQRHGRPPQALICSRDRQRGRRAEERKRASH